MIDRDDATNSIIQAVAAELHRLDLHGGLGDCRALRNEINKIVDHARTITAQLTRTRSSLPEAENKRLDVLKNTKRAFDRLLPNLDIAEDAAVGVFNRIDDEAQSLKDGHPLFLSYKGTNYTITGKRGKHIATGEESAEYRFCIPNQIDTRIWHLLPSNRIVEE